MSCNSLLVVCAVVVLPVMDVMLAWYLIYSIHTIAVRKGSVCAVTALLFDCRHSPHQRSVMHSVPSRRLQTRCYMYAYQQGKVV
jgi:hypothetical protein